MKFVYANAQEGGFDAGLRIFFAYHDLKMTAATDGKVVAPN